jgi:beta-N-acetylhexosaminidase
MRRLMAIATVLLVIPGLACSSGSGESDSEVAASAGPTSPGQTASPSAEPSVDPDAPTGWGPTEGELAEARDRVAAMTVEQQVATVLMPGFWGYDGQAPSAAEAAQNQRMHRLDTPVEVAAQRGYAGFFLRPEVISDADQVGRLASQLQEAGADDAEQLPLLISIDQEGGVVQRLKVGVPPVPSAASVGARADASYARQVARDNGRTLRDLGLTMVFAPVADVDPDGSSVIGSRAYSHDVDVAAEMVAASVKGYVDAGIVPVVKHFPGLGTVSGDSHRMLPVQRKSVDELMATDLVPFAAAIEAGAPAVMVGHVEVRALERRMPASLSTTVIGDLLRDRLGFDGVVITDSQGMGPIHARFGPAEGAIRSLLAGNDLVLNSPRPEKARRAVLDAVESGRLPAERLAEAAARVTALRIYQQRLATS